MTGQAARTLDAQGSSIRSVFKIVRFFRLDIRKRLSHMATVSSRLLYRSPGGFAGNEDLVLGHEELARNEPCGSGRSQQEPLFNDPLPRKVTWAQHADFNTDLKQTRPSKENLPVVKLLRPMLRETFRRSRRHFAEFSSERLHAHEMIRNCANFSWHTEPKKQNKVSRQVAIITTIFGGAIGSMAFVIALTLFDFGLKAAFVLYFLFGISFLALHCWHALCQRVTAVENQSY